MTAAALTGDDLTLDDVWAVAVERRRGRARRTRPASGCRRARRSSSGPRTARSEHTYGVNTGFGRFVSQQIPEELTEELQLRLLRSHACGVGEPYPDEVVRAAMLLRANALAKGNSGARVETVELLLECSNAACSRACRRAARSARQRRPRAARASRAAARRRGRGVASTASCSPGAEALARAGLEPVRLQAKEGLSLINGTQFMAALGALGLVRARAARAGRRHRLRAVARGAAGLAHVFLPQIHALRPLRGQGDSAANVLRLLDGSAIIESHRWCDKVQDAYSLRCAPQVHGATRDLLDYVEYTVASELNAATDNPLVLVEDELLVSNGNFHGQPLAFALDALAMAVAELASISERRVERLVNPNLSRRPAGVPDDRRRAQLRVHDPAVRGGVARLARTRSLCHPASVDSIPTSAGQEDHVSMGNASGLKAWQVLANAERALAIELLAGAQAVEFLAPLEPGRGARAAHDAVRTLSPRLRDDRPLGGDIERSPRRSATGRSSRPSRPRSGSSNDADGCTGAAARVAAAEAPVPRQR